MGSISAYSTYNLSQVGVVAVNDPKIPNMLNFEGPETLNFFFKFPTAISVRFLPYIGFHNENHLWPKVVHPTNKKVTLQFISPVTHTAG
jgi:hypothetical protein